MRNSRTSFTASQSKKTPHHPSKSTSREEELVHGYDSDGMNTNTSNSTVLQAKNDLMQLGIELDDELIERLQKNLGIDRIFKVAHDAAHVIKSTTRNKHPVDNDNPFDIYGNSVDHPSEMSYRHVPSSSSPDVVKTGGGKNAAAAALAAKNKKKGKSDISQIFTLNQKSSVVLLKQLENRDDAIEPQYRPLIDQMLEYLRLLYLRSPKKFLYRLLNKKMLTAEEKKILFTKKNHTNSAHNLLDGNASVGTTTTTADSAAKETEELQLIYKWILQSRYFNYQEFEDMMKRILPPSTISLHNQSLSSSSTPSSPSSVKNSLPFHSLNVTTHHHHTHLPLYHDEVIRAFFLLICDDKRFESTSKRKVVDLWNFLTLLKSSSDESRRSYDNMKSKLANDVEFWKRDNNIKYLKQSIIQSEHSPTPTSQSSTPTTVVGERDTWMDGKSNDTLNHNNHQNNKKGGAGKKENNTKTTNHHRMKNDITSRSSVDLQASAATILGQHDYQDKSRENQGRYIHGNFSLEVKNSCDVPLSVALENSPSKDMKRSRTPPPAAILRSHKIFQQDYDVPVKPPNDNIYDSSKISYLLGDDNIRKEIMQKQEKQQIQTNLRHVLEQQQYQQQQKNNNNNSSLQPPPPPPQDRKTKSIGCFTKEIVNTTTVAGALGKPDDLRKNTAETTTGLNSFSKDVSAHRVLQHERRSQNADFKKRMNNVSNLYWENSEKPSVAGAMKPGNAFVKRTTLGTDY
jgi:hypothetical protein